MAPVQHLIGARKVRLHMASHSRMRQLDQEAALVRLVPEIRDEQLVHSSIVDASQYARSHVQDDERQCANSISCGAIEGA